MLLYSLLSVYLSLILGYLQKEKLQILSFFRKNKKKRGLFQCPPLGKAGMGLLVYYVFSISPWEYRYSQQDIYLY